MLTNAATKANTATRPSSLGNFLRSTPPSPLPRRRGRRRRERYGSGPTSDPLLRSPSSSSFFFFSISLMELGSPSSLPPFILKRLSPTREEETHHNFFDCGADDDVETLERPENRKESRNQRVHNLWHRTRRSTLVLGLCLLRRRGRVRKRAWGEGHVSCQVWRSAVDTAAAACKHSSLFVRLGKTCFRIEVTRRQRQRRSSAGRLLTARTWNNRVSEAALREFANFVSHHAPFLQALKCDADLPRRRRRRRPRRADAEPAELHKSARMIGRAAPFSPACSISREEKNERSRKKRPRKSIVNFFGLTFNRERERERERGRKEERK